MKEQIYFRWGLIKNWFRDIKYGIRNIRYFLPTIWNFRGWDYHYNLDLFARSIENTANLIEKYGMEVDETRLHRVEKMRRVVWLIDNLENSIQLAEKELGEIKHRSFDEMFGEPDKDGNRLYIPDNDIHTTNVYDRSRELEVEMWEELWTIIRGSKNKQGVTRGGNTYNYSDDGTDLRGWWD